MKKLLILLTLILYGCTDDTCICTETVTNVKAVRATSSSSASAAGGNGQWNGNAYIYEIQAYGEPEGYCQII